MAKLMVVLSVTLLVVALAQISVAEHYVQEIFRKIQADVQAQLKKEGHANWGEGSEYFPILKEFKKKSLDDLIKYHVDILAEMKRKSDQGIAPSGMAQVDARYILGPIKDKIKSSGDLKDTKAIIDKLKSAANVAQAINDEAVKWKENSIHAHATWSYTRDIQNQTKEIVANLEKKSKSG